MYIKKKKSCVFVVLGLIIPIAVFLLRSDKAALAAGPALIAASGNPIPGNPGEAVLSQNDGNKPGEKPEAQEGKKSTTLKPLVIKGTKIKSRKKLEIQSISRQTMTVDEMKEVPASFGDSITALKSLPGINSGYGGIFGPLVIRGADSAYNNYFIDDIPIDNPLHFGGLHSVINTSLLSDRDVYSSAFPAEFGSATAAVINMNTIDDVREFGGYTDLGFLSTSALIKTPILKDKSGNISTDMPSHPEQDGETENVGYFIASGRYGNLILGIKASEFITGENYDISPVYWDYQFKGKYRINDVNSISMLVFGHKDYFKFLMHDNYMEEGDDPLMSDMSYKTETSSHSHGLYLDSRFSGNFSNRLMYYGTLPETYQYLDFGSDAVASWAKDIHQYYRPWVFGVKDKAKVKWMNGHSELTGGAEYTFYYFNAKGKFLMNSGMTDVFDLGDEDAITTYQRDETIKNHKVGGFLENKFTYGGLTVLPGMRSEYLKRTEQETFDPRLMSSYKFKSNTAISAAGGHYSNFMQTNPYYFNADPGLAEIDYEEKVKPEKAWHSVVGLEQELGLYSFKVEGFNNYFYDLAVAYTHYEPDGNLYEGLSCGKIKTYGLEVTIRKDLRENENGLYGWLSYTYTDSKYKSGLPTEDGYEGIAANRAGDEFGDKWFTSPYEQKHCVKLVSGYRFWQHTISGKFQFYTGYPYTAIVGSEEDLDYAAANPGKHRYVPVTDDRYTKNYPPSYQLDLRYSHKTDHSWGSITWYVEMIYALSSPDYEYKWNWTEDYSGSNPKMKKDTSYSFIPNFGVEVKF